MKTLKLSLLGLLILIFTFQSCKKDTEIKSPGNELSVSEMLTVLEKSGVDLSKTEIKKDYFLVEGDIIIKFESVPAINECLNKAGSRLKAYKYPNPYYATLSAVSSMKVYINSSVTSNGWSSAVQSAINAWNNISIGCAVNITLVSSANLANTVISTYYSESDDIAAGVAPVSGQVGNEININTYWNSLSESEKINTIAHEIGHTLGLAHSNGTSSFCTPLVISSTSSSDNSNAVMHMTSHPWTGFISDEVSASAILYPKPIIISGPSKGYENAFYTWKANAVGGTAPYTYFWEYSYDGNTYYTIGYFPSSITQQLPIGYDLHLRVTVTDSNGTVARGEKFVLNLSK